MTKLLYVETSPRKQRSASIEVARAFLAAYRQAHPADTIQEIDVWSLDLPEFDETAFEAKYAGIEGRERTPAQTTVWNRFVSLAQPFREADKIVFAVPMWNWGIPYKLKHLIDVISMKDVLFTFDERGLLGLLGGKKALCWPKVSIIPLARPLSLGISKRLTSRCGSIPSASPTLPCCR